MKSLGASMGLWVLSLLFVTGCDGGDGNDPADVSVDGDVALGALMALGDGHLQELANHFEMLAMTEEARSGDWERISGPLGASAQLADRALMWFALPDGSYWSVQEGQAEGNLSDRPYWPGLMSGEKVLGDLVVSRQTGRSAAIVAVPVRDEEDNLVGALGSSVFLEQVSQEIASAMNLGPHEFFYSMDAEPLVGLHSDTDVIFLHPMEEGDPELEQAMQEILNSDEGEVSYSFRGERRTVLFRKSNVSGWWYAFGVLRD